MDLSLTLFKKKFITHHVGYQLVYIYIYINRQNLKKIQLDFNWILNLVPCVPFNFNFVPSELLSVKIEEFKSNLIIYWILIEVQFF